MRIVVLPGVLSVLQNEDVQVEAVHGLRHQFLHRGETASLGMVELADVGFNFLLVV